MPVPPGRGKALIQIQKHHFEGNGKEADFFESYCFLFLFHDKPIVKERNRSVKDPFKSVGK